MLDLETIETVAGKTRAGSLTWGDVREARFQKRSFSRCYLENEIAR